MSRTLTPPLGAEITGTGVSPEFGVREALARVVDKGDLSADFAFSRRSAIAASWKNLGWAAAAL